MSEAPLHQPEQAGQHRDLLRPAQIFALAGLSAVGAELLAGYSGSTGSIPATLFALVFFMGLYGAPALLVREVARRAGWGWPSLIWLVLALAITQACIIDQSLFSGDYQGYEGWAETRAATFIPVLSISAHNAYNFVIGHVIFSFAAPIAIAEAWRSDRALKPWLGPVGMTVAAAAYLGTATLIMIDPESQSASRNQLIVSIVLVLACVAAAWLAGQRHGRRTSIQGAGPAPRPATLFALTLVLTVVGVLGGDGWAGFALGMATTGLVGALVWWGARRPGWGLRHAAAVGFAFLVSRGLFAFTYFPLAGEVDAASKYGHNIVMLLLVLAAGWLALRHRSSGTSTASGSLKP